jgi:hypothetical protein
MIDEDEYRLCLARVCKAENKRMQHIHGSKGVWISQMDAKSRGSIGGRPRRKVFFDPQDTHNDDGSLK